MPKSDVDTKSVGSKSDKSNETKESEKEPVQDFVFKSFRRRPRGLGSGGVLRKTAALGRLIKWPKYVRLQRQRKILMLRMKIPPSLSMFKRACNRQFARQIVRFLKDYSPESKKQKELRLRANAKLQAEGKPIPSEKKIVIKFGFNHVTNLIEGGRAKLVIIAHDVHPIELVLWMPTLCVKKNIPFVIMKSKSRLGALVHKKTASCLAMCEVNPGDDEKFKEIVKEARRKYNNNFNNLKKQWSKPILGIKTRHKIQKRKRQRAEERERRAQALSKSGQ